MSADEIAGWVLVVGALLWLAVGVVVTVREGWHR